MACHDANNDQFDPTIVSMWELIQSQNDGCFHLGRWMGIVDPIAKHIREFADGRGLPEFMQVRDATEFQQEVNRERDGCNARHIDLQTWCVFSWNNGARMVNFMCDIASIDE